MVTNNSQWCFEHFAQNIMNVHERIENLLPNPTSKSHYKISARESSLSIAKGSRKLLQRLFLYTPPTTTHNCNRICIDFGRATLHSFIIPSNDVLPLAALRLVTRRIMYRIGITGMILLPDKRSNAIVLPRVLISSNTTTVVYTCSDNAGRNTLQHDPGGQVRFGLDVDPNDAAAVGCFYTKTIVNRE